MIGKEAGDLKLPQGILRFSPEISPPPVVLVAGGRAPEIPWLQDLVRLGVRAVWGVDRGARWCRRAGICPDRFVGDGDSLEEEDRRWLHDRRVPQHLHPVAKDFTDLQLALFEAADEYPGVPIVLTGTGGGRFDHAFSALFSALWAHRRGGRVVALGDSKELLIPLRGPTEVALAFAPPPDVVSSLALSSECSGVTLKGTEWPLEGVTLYLEEPYAVSNRLTMGVNDRTFEVIQGWLGVYAAWDIDLWAPSIDDRRG